MILISGPEQTIRIHVTYQRFTDSGLYLIKKFNQINLDH